MTAANKLTGCPNCGATISVDARFCGGCGTAISSTEPTYAGANPMVADNQIGREIAGRYRILAKLGEGGMGAVFRAEQISLKRKVALKLLKPELSADPGLVRRFNAEAELAAKLNHPNTVTLYDFGQDSDGSLFIAMEFIEGRSLREVMVTEGPLPVARIVDVGVQVCSSLADAHGRGIVHRDLKPDNVMLSTRGKKTDVVRVLDFGIAKLRDTQGDMTQMPMTRAGDLLGTPQYMAPEQIRGEKVDARTDIYAMGAMIYEMVTGRLPFEAPTLMAILSKHLTEMPVPPSERRADLAIPEALSSLVMSMLAKDPAQRPPTMDRVSDQLEAIGASAPQAGSEADVAGVIAPVRPSGAMQVPSVVSAPPGVPRRLTTPGSQNPLQRPVTPPPGPPPQTPAPLYAQHQGPQIQPPVAPMPAMPVQRAPQTLQVRRGQSSGLIWAIIAAVLIGGAGLGAFFALRAEGKSKRSTSSPSPATTSSSSSPSSTGSSEDVPSLGDWEIKDDGDDGDGDVATPPAPASTHADDADFFGDRRVDDLVWRHPAVPVHIHYPQGFSLNTAAAPWAGFSGTFRGTPTEIGVFAANTGIAQPEGTIRVMVQNTVSSIGGVIVEDTHRVFAGASRFTGTYEVRGQVKGQFVVYQQGPMLVVVGVAVPSGKFAASKKFRDAFFDRAVAIDP